MSIISINRVSMGIVPFEDLKRENFFRGEGMGEKVSPREIWGWRRDFILYPTFFYYIFSQFFKTRITELAT
jgi:hypothetical protein